MGPSPVVGCLGQAPDDGTSCKHHGYPSDVWEATGSTCQACLSLCGLSIHADMFVGH